MSNGAKKVQDLLACVEYEHRKKNGTLVSRGKQTIDRHRRVHIIQEDGRGRRIGEVIFDKDNNILEIKEGEPELREVFRKFVDAIKGR